MMNKRLIPAYAIVLSIFLFLFQHIGTLPPAAKVIESPLDEFSAGRAYETLKYLLKENAPHPAGSALNKVVKERLIEEFKSLDIEFEEQQTWACATRFASCIEVENLIGFIPGKSDLPYLALMAHYDSVPVAPGAGDDGAGVVAILEAARILKEEGPYEHPIMLLITDAEENGLVGAEAFFNQHPLAKSVGIVLNVEGSGSSGSSMILRTSKKNELLINSYSHEHDNPYGFSFVKEIFKRMPNDTDFSVVERANIPGIDFAFAGERNHYHTPNDTLENIDLRTIQHHGENILNTSRELLSSNWDDMGEEYLYGGEIYGIWTQWKSSNSLFIFLFSIFLLAYSLIKLKVNIKNTALGIIFSPITFLLTVLSGVAGFYLLSYFSGNVISWPGIDWPYRLLLVGSTVTGLLIATALSRKYVADHELLLGSWLFWSILTFVVTITLPDAANTFILPLLFASLIIFVSTFLKDTYKVYFLLLTLVITLPSTLGLIFSLEQSQGYKLVWAMLPFIGLFAFIISPFLYNLNLKSGIVFTSTISIVALFAGSYMNLYTENRPQHINIHFYENIDTAETYIHLSGNYKNVADSNPEALIEPLSSYVDEISSKSLMSFAPNHEMRYWADSKSSNWNAPFIVNKEILKDKDSIRLNLKSSRSASRLAILLPKESNLKSFNLGSVEFKASFNNRGAYKDYYVIYMNGVYNENIELTLNFKEYKQEIDAFLLDISTELPEHLNDLYKARTGIFSPVHRGDQAVLIKKIKI